MRSLFTTQICLMALLLPCCVFGQEQKEGDGSKAMDKLWGGQVIKLRAENAERGQLFDEGNYEMFIHWGLYSQLANKVDDKTSLWYRRMDHESSDGRYSNRGIQGTGWHV